MANRKELPIEITDRNTIASLEAKPITVVKQDCMYFYPLKTKQNEQTELLEMRCAFGVIVRSVTISFYVNITS